MSEVVLTEKTGHDQYEAALALTSGRPAQETLTAADVVISNGVVNLAPDKAAVFREAARLLKPGGRLAIADIVTELSLPDSVICNATLWAACIGGAMQQHNYNGAIEAAGLQVTAVRDNPEYRFISENAKGAQQKWGVKSISLLAVKP
jgi:SAM-dependent methyltransferase